MRILVTSQFWHPENGIPQRRWTWLSGILRDQGHQVDVIAPQPHYRRDVSAKDALFQFGTAAPVEEGISGERIYRSPFLPAGESLTSRAVGQAFIALGALVTALKYRSVVKKADIVIGTVPALPTAIVAFLIAKIARKPYIIDLRDAWPDLLSQSRSWNLAVDGVPNRSSFLRNCLLGSMNAVVEKILNFILKHADTIIVTSEELGKSIEARYSSEMSSSSSRIVPNVELVRNVFPAKTKRKSSVRVRDASSGLRVLYAGTVGRAQNLRNAIDAVALAQRRGLGIDLRVMGAGAAVGPLQSYAEDIGARIRFEALRNPSGLSDVYEWADTALVHLTDWEPLERAVPSKAYELMSMRIHITAVARGEVSDIVNHFKVGHVVEPESPEQLVSLWESLIENPEWLEVEDLGASWVSKQRQEVVPDTIKRICERYA